MIKEVTGDLLTCGANIICHQVNYLGVMGGGVAYSIRKKMLSDENFAQYKDFCAKNGSKTLGRVLWLYPGQKFYPTQAIANLFSQRTKEDDNGNLTSYSALKRCLKSVEGYARKHNLTVAVPAKIGCGIAGGDWQYVQSIIRDIFVDSPVELTIVYWRPSTV